MEEKVIYAMYDDDDLLKVAEELENVMHEKGKLEEKFLKKASNQ